MDPQLRGFIRQSIPSVLALEVLLFLRAHRTQAWTPEAVAGALRNSAPSCEVIMISFAGRGLVAQDEAGCVYRPDSPALEELVGRLQDAYRERRVAVTNAIVGKGA